MATSNGLVIVRHYEPPEPEERAGMMRAVYDQLFDAETLERLTQSQGESRIPQGVDNESCELWASQY